MQRYDENKNVSNASSTEGFGFLQKKCRVHISSMVKKEKKVAHVAKYHYVLMNTCEG